jgi:hypothetical protein
MIKTALSFNRSQWRHFGAALMLLPRIDLRLKKDGFAATRDWIDRQRETTRKSILNQDEMAFSRDVAMAVNVAGRRSIWPTSCLRQALALRYFLGRYGIESELRIGVRGGQRDFAAHAWVEKNGIVLIGGEYAGERYVALTH